MPSEERRDIVAGLQTGRKRDFARPGGRCGWPLKRCPILVTIGRKIRPQVVYYSGQSGQRDQVGYCLGTAV